MDHLTTELDRAWSEQDHGPTPDGRGKPEILSDIGRLAGILGILWGIFAIFSGRLSDKIGHRKILIPAIIVFSLMSGLSGMVQGLTALILIRAFMGAMEAALRMGSRHRSSGTCRPVRAYSGRRPSRGCHIPLPWSGAIASS